MSNPKKKRAELIAKKLLVCNIIIYIINYIINKIITIPLCLRFSLCSFLFFLPAGPSKELPSSASVSLSYSAASPFFFWILTFFDLLALQSWLF